MGSLMHVGRKGWPIQSHTCSTLAPKAEKCDANSDRKGVRVHSALEFFVYGAAKLQNSQGAHAHHCPLLKAPMMAATTMNFRPGPRSNVDSCACASPTWGTLDTRMHYGKSSSWQRQCTAGKPWVLPSTLCYFDT